MNKSVFSYFASFLLAEDQSNRGKDFHNGLFSWLLSNVDGGRYAEKYVEFLWERLKKDPPDTDCPKGKIEISTQEHATDVGRIDLMIRVGDEIGFICEHKTWTRLKENQIGKYMDFYNNKDTRKYYSVLVTQNASQHEQNPDVAITWEEIHTFTETLLTNYDQGSGNWVLLNQFLKFLQENLIDHFDPIKIDILERYWEAMNIKFPLGTLFSRVAEHEWEVEFPNLSRFSQGKLNPSYRKMIWGRIGIQFFDVWTPGIFAGVLLNPWMDHYIYPLHHEKGPEFIIVVEADPNSELYDQIKKSDWYATKCKELEANAGEFNFLPGVERNRYRMLILRKPLSDILADTKTFEEQKEALIKTIRNGLELILS